MKKRPEDFWNIQPDRVNNQTLSLCERKLKEPLLKATLRCIYSIYLKYRYQINPMGADFKWGRWHNWCIRRGVLKVGHYVFIGPGAIIIYPTVIGDLCMIARETHFVGNDHGFEQVGVPVRLAEPKEDARSTITIIESEAWIGQRSTIFAGIKIGRGSIVAAGSVVTKDVPAYSIVAGVPAKFIRKRFQTESEEIEHIKQLYG